MAAAAGVLAEVDSAMDSKVCRTAPSVARVNAPFWGVYFSKLFLRNII